MKESTNKDIAQFFYDKTADFDKNPPEELWDNISKDISKVNNGSHLQSFIKNIYLFPVLFGGLLVVAIVFFIKSDKNIEETNKIIKTEIIEENIETNIIENKSSIKFESNKFEISENNIEKSIIIDDKEIEEKDAKSNTVKTENADNVVEVAKITPVEFDTSVNIRSIEFKGDGEDDITVKKRIYNISAATFSNIDKIHFVKNNGKEELIKVVDKPVLNPFGYYEIDITDLLPGTYRVRVLEEGKWVEHKLETFN